MRNADELVRAEVLCCMSSVVSVLAALNDGNNNEEATAQARDLQCSVPDYEDAATDAGWDGPHKDEFGVTYFDNDGDKWACAGWQELCEEFDIEPYDREVFEHWAVTPWLGFKLADMGEKVDEDFCGLCVWARTTTGQAISIDWVIEKLVEDLKKAA